jgi:hypothetical protein
MTTIFCCFLKKKESIIKLLKNKPAGYSHPFKDMLLTHTGGGNITKTPINANPAFYLNNASLDQANKQVIKSFEMFPAYIGRYANYTYQTLLPGQSGMFRAVDGEVLIVYGTIRKPTYFDGIAYTKDGVIYYYRNTDANVRYLKHSGDLNADNLLLHTLTKNGDPDNRNPQVTVIAACGYNNNQLHTFAPSNPHILMIDHVNQIVYIVPFTLDRASIGNSHLIAPLVIEQSENGCIRWYIPDTPIQYTNISSGGYPLELKTIIKKVTEEFPIEFNKYQDRAKLAEQHAAQAAQAATSQLTETIDKSLVSKSNLLKDKVGTLFVENGVACPLINSKIFEQRNLVLCELGRTLKPKELKEQPIIRPCSVANLPILLGSAENSNSLALGEESDANITSEEWEEYVLRTLSLVFASPRWIESTLQANLWRINGVLAVSYPFPPSAHDSRDSLVRFLNDMCIPCTRLMGGCAIILIFDESTKKYFFYRGPYSLWPGLFPKEVAFGDQVDFSVERFEEFATALQQQGAVPLPFSFAVPDKSKVIIWDGKQIDSAQEIIDLLAAVSSVSDLLKLRPIIQAAFAQISVGYNTIEVQSLQQQIREIAHKQIELLLEPERKKIQIIRNLIKTGDLSFDDIKKYSQELGGLRGEERKKTKQVAFILDDLEMLSSCQVTSTRSVSLQSSMRKAVIQENLKTASEMTPDDFAELLEKICNNCVIGQTINEEMTELLQCISNKNLGPYLRKINKDLIAYALRENEWPEELKSAMRQLSPDDLSIIDRALKLCDKGSTFDASTMSCLLVGTGAGEASNHPLATKGTPIAFRLQLQFCCIAIPLQKDTYMWDGKNYIDFMNRANEPNVALFRMLWRKNFSELLRRDCPIDVASKELSIGSVIMILSLMESIRSKMSHVPTEADRDNTTCEMMRGLMDIAMTFAAAGATPASFVFQLIQPGANITLPSTPEEWAIYAWVARLFLWCGMNTDTLIKQATLLLVRSLRKMIVDPVTAPLRAGVAAAKKVEGNNSQQKRNIALQWYKALCKMFHRFDPNTEDPISVETAIACAKILLDNEPTAGKHKSTLKKCVRSLNMIKSGHVLTEEEWAFIRKYVAQISIKYSGCFKESKKKAIIKANRSEDPAPIINKRVEFIAKQLKINPDEVIVTNRALFVLPEDVPAKDKDEALKAAVGKMKGCADNTKPQWGCRCEYNPSRATDVIYDTKFTAKRRKKTQKQLEEEWANLQCPEHLTCDALLGNLLDKKKVHQDSGVEILDKEQIQLISALAAPEPFDALKKLDPAKSGAALELADKIRTITVIEALEQSKLPIEALISLFISAGCPPDKMQDTIAVILKELLLGWQDIVESERAACAAFRACISQ